MTKKNSMGDRQGKRPRFRANALTAVNALALLGGAVSPLQAAMAQAAQAQREQGDQLEQVIVTGTRIVRDGYEAPTPLAVMTAETLQQSTASANVADTLVRMPVFANSQSPSSSVSGASAATPLSRRRS